ncbi:Zn-dependent peptidase ImmA, M78 family [Chryseolinea serpens]|uniref:Zn-dependent peptidase ImmA, M78 family n=1 Tax=Chryseolinea serpens TaxID=947013 RepID=A0A1M5ULU2_9BACT|nr:XRE family transcriptional regulator [Chryseolinea serpens]SHH63921.1 Zn-dependent peptidase ImmA, M78 family [Chryseolinea serpens]
MTLFNPEMLVLARESRGLTQKELAEKINIGQGTLSKIENGIFPVDEHISVLSATLNYPKSFFYQTSKIYQPSEYFFRKKLSLSKKELDKIKAITSIFRFNIDSLLRSVNLKEMDIPIWNVEIHGTPSQAARYLRSYWSIPRGRIESLIGALENKGIIVLEFAFDSPKFDGLSLFAESGTPIIFVNKTLSSDRQRLTVAHELGHLVLHCRQIIASIRDVEDEAFEFASELLMPADEIYGSLLKLSLAKLADLKRYWKTSMASIIFHARRMKAITENQYKYLWIQMGSNGYRVKEPVALDFPKEKPSLLGEILDAHINTLNYTIEELSSVFHLHPSEIEHSYFAINEKFVTIKRAV